MATQTVASAPKLTCPETTANPPATSILFDNDTTDLTFWREYITARPEYSPLYWKSLFDYHNRPDPWSSQRGSPRYSLAHDIACGPGNNLPSFSQFNHVVASDISPSALRAAAQLMPHDLLARSSLLHLPGEDLATANLSRIARSLVGGSPVPRGLRGTADLVHLSEAIPLMDTPRAIDSCSTLLKQGGTCCISFYGAPAFLSAPQCQAAFDALTATVTQTLLAMKRLDARLSEYVSVTMTSKLDNLHFNRMYWEDIERHYWLHDKSMMLFKLDGIKPITRVAETEKKVVHHNTEDAPMRMTVDFKRILKMMESIFVASLEELRLHSEVKRCLDEFEQVMGLRSWEVVFPSVMILARKR